MYTSLLNMAVFFIIRMCENHFLYLKSEFPSFCFLTFLNRLKLGQKIYSVSPKGYRKVHGAIWALNSIAFHCKQPHHFNLEYCTNMIIFSVYHSKK